MILELTTYSNSQKEHTIINLELSILILLMDLRSWLTTF